MLQSSVPPVLHFLVQSSQLQLSFELPSFPSKPSYMLLVVSLIRQPFPPLQLPFSWLQLLFPSTLLLFSLLPVLMPSFRPLAWVLWVVIIFISRPVSTALSTSTTQPIAAVRLTSTAQPIAAIQLASSAQPISAIQLAFTALSVIATVLPAPFYFAYI